MSLVRNECLAIRLCCTCSQLKPSPNVTHRCDKVPLKFSLVERLCFFRMQKNICILLDNRTGHNNPKVISLRPYVQVISLSNSQRKIPSP